MIMLMMICADDNNYYNNDNDYDEIENDYDDDFKNDGDAYDDVC